MDRRQKNDNFVDKTFTIVADILLKILPASKKDKQAFSYYREGLYAQSKGEYAEALKNYFEALKIEEDPYNRSYILYNMGLIYSSNGKYQIALKYYNQSIALNSNLPQAFNNMAVIYHYQGVIVSKNEKMSKIFFNKAEFCWKEAIRIEPNNYIEAQQWLKVTGRN